MIYKKILVTLIQLIILFYFHFIPKNKLTPKKCHLANHPWALPISRDSMRVLRNKKTAPAAEAKKLCSIVPSKHVPIISLCLSIVSCAAMTSFLNMLTNRRLLLLKETQLSLPGKLCAAKWQIPSEKQMIGSKSTETSSTFYLLLNKWGTQTSKLSTKNLQLSTQIFPSTSLKRLRCILLKMKSYNCRLDNQSTKSSRLKYQDLNIREALALEHYGSVSGPSFLGSRLTRYLYSPMTQSICSPS